jgi:hypothetical protein
MTDDLPPDPSPHVTLAVVTLTASDGRKLIDRQLAVVELLAVVEDSE